MANQEPTEPSKPCERPLDDPAVPVATQPAPILVCCVRVVHSRGDDRFDPLQLQPHPQRIAVVATVEDKPVGIAPRVSRSMRPAYRNGVERRLEETDFRWGRRVQMCSQRSTLAIDQQHPLRTLAPLRLADGTPPFFAGAKLPSPKHSSQRILSRSLRSARNARHSASRVPSSSQSRSRRQQVVELPYFRGNSLQGDPVHRIQRIPSKHLRSSAGGRPPLGFFLRLGSPGAIRSHWASVRPLHAIAHLPVMWHGGSLHRLAGFWNEF